MIKNIKNKKITIFGYGSTGQAAAKLAYHLEEPRVGQSYPNFYAAKLASKFVK